MAALNSFVESIQHGNPAPGVYNQTTMNEFIDQQITEENPPPVP